MATDGEKRLFTTNFVLICLVTLIIFISFYLLVPVLPMYIIRGLGGQASDLGLMMGVFAVASVLTYPLIGRASDRRGRKFFLLAGLCVYILAVLLYIPSTILPTLLVIRLLHGACWAAVYSTLSTLVSDIAPITRRGEAIGYFGISANLAMAVGPWLSLNLMQTYDFPVLFLISAILAVPALAIAFRVTETLVRQPRETIAAVPVAKQSRPKIDLLPTSVMFSITVSYGAVMVFLPIYAADRGVDNPGIFFAVFAITLIATRVFGGRLSDKFGRHATIIPGIILVIASMVMLSVSATLPALIVTAIVYGAGFGSLHPALMALAVDRVAPQHRGVAMGNFAGSFDLGMGVGSVILGGIAQFAGLSNLYLAAGLIAFLGLIIFVLAHRNLKSASTIGNGSPAVTNTD